MPAGQSGKGNNSVTVHILPRNDPMEMLASLFAGAIEDRWFLVRTKFDTEVHTAKSVPMKQRIFPSAESPLRGAGSVARAGARQRLLAATVTAASLALSTLAVSAQGYHSNDLTPAGSPSGRLAGTSSGKQVGAAVASDGYSHAVVLSGNALTAVDLQPAGYYYSMAMCADDTQQGGWGYNTLGGIHALVWNGSSSSYADLNPSGYNFSYCFGVHNGEQVGYAQSQVYFITGSRAMSWHGSAASAVDLHPAWTYPYSRALGCRNGEEVGFVSSVAYPDGDWQGYATTSHAVRWAGTAASAVDLHPVGYDASSATCTSGTQQGGWGYIALGTSHQHALLWSGDAASVVDLHPAGFTDSKVTSLTATQQVGEGWIGPANTYGSSRHALVWSSTAESVVDLNQYLPAGITNGVATGVDANGNIVGYAYNGYSSGLSIPTGAVAVVFAPGAAPAVGLASITVSPTSVAPGDAVQVTVAVGAAAPAGGLNLSFLSTAPAILPTPAAVQIPEGESSVSFALTAGGATLMGPSSLKLYATDGTVSSAAPLTIVPVVNLTSLTANPVEGGFSTYGAINLSIPAQAGGAVVALTSGDANLAAVPATVVLPQGYSALSFAINTAPVSVATQVAITASLNGKSVSGTVSLSPAPVVALAGLSAPELVGGQPVFVTVSVNNFPRGVDGATITLTSGDVGTLQVPATVTVPQGAYTVTVAGTSSVVPGRKGVSLKAAYNGGTLTTTVFVNPIPTVVITQADYLTDTKMFKVAATTTFTNAVLTYGGSPDAAPLGTMQFEAGVFKGSMILDVAPTQATVWNSQGGMATVPVSIKTSSAVKTGGGGGGGGGTTTTSFKLTLVTNGKGSVTTTPSGTSFPAGTVVTLKATPAAGSPWVGWSGAVTGTANPTTVTITKDTSVTANFR